MGELPNRVEQLKYNIGGHCWLCPQRKYHTTCIIVATKENHNEYAFAAGFDYLIQEEGSKTLISVFEDDIWEFNKDD